MSSAGKISRRAFLSLGAATVAAFPQASALAAAERTAFRHGYSPLGSLKYSSGFSAFDYVDPQAPKGGTIRLARIGTFDTFDTLHYPGSPPEDIRLLYDHLIVASDDEAAGYYGLLADSIVVSDDFAVIALKLNGDARWHTGEPVSAEDVVFTFETLMNVGAPFYRQSLRTLTVTAEAPDRVVILNQRPGDRDVIRRISMIPIHPAHVWRGGGPEGSSPEPIGSGPYRLVEIDAPRRLVLERVPDYWGADLGVNRGRWNFDRLVFDYYRDNDIALEAFRAGEYDLRVEDSPVRWRSGYEGPALGTGEIKRTATPTVAAGDLHGIVFNLRRPQLADRRVRLALTLAYDFDALNRTLFGGGYQRFGSAFGDTDLAAEGPATEDELAILAGSGETPSRAVFADPDPLAGLPMAGSRAAIAEASRLLDEAGYPIEDGIRVDPARNAPLAFTIVSPNPLYEGSLEWLARAWERLGVGMVHVRLDPATASRRMLDRDFDLAALSWSPARLPGTAERLLWHSDLAEAPHSYALSGVASPALDTAIEALEAARSPAALQTAGHAFDRVFRHALVILPLWRDSTTRLAWWDRFERPQTEHADLPSSPLDRWWATT